MSIEAMKRVVEAQRHFDALVAEVKKSAPRETDWRRPVGQHWWVNKENFA